ncbi:gamma-glutamylcyclotransferase b isoform X1 [Ictalurus punctatus]|uniref:Gamma-glutamylcyclotransferase b isoform X1 n=1 Tax=Ictalurus punctatus TaxID=7998 RepID=A0A2D0SSD3_ICTPU|nr:gamma-glutamylcyclotransferase b isoform X1 [Ictalurus punctatus]
MQLKPEMMAFRFTLNIIFISVAVSLVLAADTLTDPQTFLYFAYGSNLLKERLQLNNPSATRHCVAKLQDYKLVFGNHKGVESKRWHGGVASIEPSGRGTVWGVVWRINTAHMTHLDRQEGVRSGVYSPVSVNVLSHGHILTCRTYIMNSRVQALPSPHYLKVIMMGAEQNRLPKAYQDKLKSIKTNKYDGSLPVMDEVCAALKNSKKKKRVSLCEIKPV